MTVSKGNLLIVDDETHLLAVLQFALARTADRIFIAETGQDALAILEKETVNCVLCDINLPRMTGLEILKEVRSRQNAVPFIFYTAESGQEAIKEAARLGALDYFFKPHFKGIEPAIVTVLSGKDYKPDPASEFAQVLEGK